jgi:hypothetical protein
MKKYIGIYHGIWVGKGTQMLSDHFIISISIYVVSNMKEKLLVRSDYFLPYKIDMCML